MPIKQFLYHSLMYRCEGKFPAFCLGHIEEMAKEKRWTVMLLCRKTGGISLVLRETNPGRGDRGGMTLSPGQGGPATAGDEHL
jgi:hypothetical protein